MIKDHRSLLGITMEPPLYYLTHPTSIRTITKPIHTTGPSSMAFSVLFLFVCHCNPSPSCEMSPPPATNSFFYHQLFQLIFHLSLSRLPFWINLCIFCVSSKVVTSNIIILIVGVPYHQRRQVSVRMCVCICLLLPNALIVFMNEFFHVV